MSAARARYWVPAARGRISAFSRTNHEFAPVVQIHILERGTLNSSTHPDGLKRGLKNRHIQLIALGGAIGTGLFLGSASVLQAAGPSMILGYAIGGFKIGRAHV